ncbi:MAG: aldehyde ferredoxin oxidoreductase family protein [Thermococcus sp.]|uniref:aldehyde ferredoxin oxidoreductase family protein n=1 Tax=Thermococcus sp. TaxID=35749 RepID=UPI001E0ABDC3|nr:aldehyde ferredoxin oxidoreductase family protein [Thermococcus sp.]MBO8174065.1 aldehyde ferredoxin oxidoreductase family protein [Thermococcus sp.]
MKIARIDLTKQSVKLLDVPKGWEKEYIGGKGIATKLLFEIPPKIDPFHPANAIIFGIGPITGVPLPGSSRMTAVFKSPLTFGYGESQCGGFIGYEMRKTGIDFLYITGKAKKPVYIMINEQSVEIKDASHLWGKDTFEVEEILEKDEGGEVLSIGQAGENLVRFACATHRKGRQFGRCGIGAVMGSKRLKAIVIKGDKEIEVADPEGLKEFRKWMQENIVSKLMSLREYGTPAISIVTNEVGALPTKYWQEGSFDEFEKISLDVFNRYTKRHSSCYACSVACGKIRTVNGIEVEGPEYETLYAFGSLCYNSDPESIMKANELCDRYGLDTITAGNVIAFYMACSEAGEVKEKVNFGDSEGILDLIEKIAFREGIGDVLAEGTRIAAEKLNVSIEPVHVRGLEPAGYDPRALYGMALGYATSQRGACHLRSCAYRANLAGLADPQSPEGQAEIVKDYEDFYCVVDSLVFCRFLCVPAIGLYWEDISELYKIVTGKEISVEKLKEIGAKIWGMTREFNLREGLTDVEALPSTFFKPLKHRNLEITLKREDFEKMVQEYKKLRGLE